MMGIVIMVYLIVSDFFNIPSMDKKKTLVSAAESPQLVTENRYGGLSLTSG